MRYLILIIGLIVNVCYAQSIQQDSCSSLNKRYYKNSNIVESVSTLFYFDNENCELRHTIYNQILWMNDEHLSLYSIELPDTWYKNGKPHKVLSYVDNSEIIVYKHYNKKGKLIGEEFFIHDSDKKQFFQFTGQWWKKNIFGRKVSKNIPPFYDEKYFDY